MKGKMGNKRYFYITPEDFEKAKENGIPKDTVLTRVRMLGWDVDRAITKPPRKIRKFTKEEIKIMEENGIDRNTVSCRLNYGWTLEEAISRPKKPGRQYIYPEWVYEEANKNGIAYGTVNSRIKDGWDMKRACTERVKTRQESAEIARKKLKESKEVRINE